MANHLPKCQIPVLFTISLLIILKRINVSYWIWSRNYLMNRCRPKNTSGNILSNGLCLSQLWGRAGTVEYFSLQLSGICQKWCNFFVNLRHKFWSISRHLIGPLGRSDDFTLLNTIKWIKGWWFFLYLWGKTQNKFCLVFIYVSVFV